MAKNYSIRELRDVMVEHTDVAAMQDICRRYPNLAPVIRELPEVAVDILASLNWLSARQIDRKYMKYIAGDVEEAEEAQEG